VNDSTFAATLSFFVFPVVVLLLAWAVRARNRRRR
jgi:hypothetical protein